MEILKRNSSRSNVESAFKPGVFGMWWREHHWFIIGGIALITLLLGYSGFRNYFIALRKPSSVGNLLYLTLQLFVLESGAVLGSINWQLQIARFLAPLVATYTAFRAIAIIFRERLQLLRVRFFRDHVIICGLGEKGMLLAQRFRKRGYGIVIIEIDEENDRVNLCRDQGIIVLIGDASDPEILRKARIYRAKYLISVCGKEGTNTEVAVQGRGVVISRRKKPLRCVIHIENPELYRLLRERELETKEVRLDFFNIFDIGARTWLEEYSLSPNVLIVGAGKLGENLIVQMVKKWKALGGGMDKKIRISIIDRSAKVKKDLLTLRYKNLEKFCEIICKDMDFESPEFQQANFLIDKKGQSTVSSIFVCLSKESLALSVALTLNNRIRGLRIPIVVRMTHDAEGLATLFQEEREGFANLNAFGLLDKTCQVNSVLHGTHEVIARAIHEYYVKNRAKEGDTLQTNPSMVSWDKLPEALKESNRRQADHIFKKLKSLGYGLAPLMDIDPELFKFGKSEGEKLAILEHKRWVEDRKRDGWRFGPKKKIERKVSSYFGSWEELPPDIKEYDRQAVWAIPKILAEAGFEIYKLK